MARSKNKTTKEELPVVQIVLATILALVSKIDPEMLKGIASSLRTWYASLTPRGQSITLWSILGVAVFYIPGLWLLKLIFAVYLFLAKEPILSVGKASGWKRDTRATKWTDRTEQSLVAALQGVPARYSLGNVAPSASTSELVEPSEELATPSYNSTPPVLSAEPPGYQSPRPDLYYESQHTGAAYPAHVQPYPTYSQDTPPMTPLNPTIFRAPPSRPTRDPVLPSSPSSEGRASGIAVDPQDTRGERRHRSESFHRFEQAKKFIDRKWSGAFRPIDEMP